jgi:hypothetical protein
MFAVSVKSDAASAAKGLRELSENLTAKVWSEANDLAAKSRDFFRDKELRGNYVEHYRRRTGYGLQMRSGKTDDETRRSFESNYSYSNKVGKITFFIGGRALAHDQDRTISRAAGWIIFPGDDAVDSRGVVLPQFTDSAVAALRANGETFWMPTKSPTLAFIGYRPVEGQRALRIRVASKRVFHPKRVSPEIHFTFTRGVNEFFNRLADLDFFTENFTGTVNKAWPKSSQGQMR